MQIADQVRFRLHRNFDPRDNVSVIFPNEFAKEIQVHISKISRSLRDLEYRQEILRVTKNESGKVLATLLPKFFQNIRISEKPESGISSEDGVITMRPALLGMLQRPTVFDIFPKLYVLSNQKPTKDNEALLREAKIAITFLSRTLKICPHSEVGILRLLAKNMDLPT